MLSSFQLLLAEELVLCAILSAAVFYLQKSSATLQYLKNSRIQVGGTREVAAYHAVYLPRSDFINGWDC